VKEMRGAVDALSVSARRWVAERGAVPALSVSDIRPEQARAGRRLEALVSVFKQARAGPLGPLCVCSPQLRRGLFICSPLFICSLILFIVLFIPGIVLLAGNANQNPLSYLGEDGGQTASTCTIAAVYHRNVVFRTLGHHHHPHSPGKGRRLDDDGLAAHADARHRHLPSPGNRRLDDGLARHQHLPSRPPKQHPDVKSSSPERDSQPKLPATSSPSMPTTSTSEAASVTPEPVNARGVNALGGTVNRRGLGHSQFDCYDRYVFAFSTVEASGEPLNATRARLEARGFVEVDPPTDPLVLAGVPVVLSPPVHLKRAACALPTTAEPLEGLTYQSIVNSSIIHSTTAPGGMGSQYGTITSLWSPVSLAYESPTTTIRSACHGTELSAWWTNPAYVALLGSGMLRYEVPGQTLALSFVEWPFSPHGRAPSNWELSQFGVNSLYESKQWTGPIPIVEKARRCEVSNVMDRRFSQGCRERQRPDWSTDCPLHVGAQLPCWHSTGVTKPDVLDMFGCSDVSPAAGLGQVIRGLVGQGPPNPLCYSIFPPSWRMADWFSVEWVATTQRFDPFWLVVSGIIIITALPLSILTLLTINKGCNVFMECILKGRERELGQARPPELRGSPPAPPPGEENPPPEGYAGVYHILTTKHEAGQQPAGWGLSCLPSLGARRNELSSWVHIHSGNCD
jgi:hypothetical protein